MPNVERLARSSHKIDSPRAMLHNPTKMSKGIVMSAHSDFEGSRSGQMLQTQIRRMRYVVRGLLVVGNLANDVPNSRR